jgi:hypothetical protein
MAHLSVRNMWVQTGLVLAVIFGVVAGDIAVAQARIAENHRKSALLKLQRAETAFAVKVDGISKSLYFTVQPVQDALDKADASDPLLVEAARNTVVNAKISGSVSKLAGQVKALTPPKTMVESHKALTSASRGMATHLANLEKAKKSKEATDLLDTPYSGYAYSLAEALDNWHAALSKVDTAAHRAIAPAPGAAGSPRSKLKMPASKASWIFAADRVCGVASHALYNLKEPGRNASPSAYAKFFERHVVISKKLVSDLKKLPLPAADKSRLTRGVYKALSADVQLQSAYSNLASALRHLDYSKFQRAEAQQHVALKGMRTLSSQFKTYGAEFCGWFYDPKADAKSDKGKGGSVSA